MEDGVLEEANEGKKKNRTEAGKSFSSESSSEDGGMDGGMDGLPFEQQETHADMQTQPGGVGGRGRGHKSTRGMNTHADEEFS